MDTRTPPIIVAVDGSASSIAALRHAGELASDLGCGLKAVAVWQPPEFYMADLRLDDEPFEREAAEHLREAISQVFGTDVPDSLTTAVRRGRPATVLVDEAQDARMLVMGSRGHGEFVSMLLGSVSLECISHASVPVTVVRADHG